MNHRPRSGLILSIVIIAMLAPLFVASQSAPGEEPWPALLAGDPASIDPGVASLQQRADASLERLVRLAQATP